MGTTFAIGGSLLAFAVILAGAVAWCTHIIFCITHSLWLLLLAGAIVAPVGAVHGVMIWFGNGWGI